MHSELENRTYITCYRLQPPKIIIIIIIIIIINEKQPNTKDSKRSNLKSLITNLGAI